MDIYEKFKTCIDKTNYFKGISFDEKINLWFKLSNSEKKSLFSRLSVKDIYLFLSSMNSGDRKECYELFDEKKLKGYFKILNDDEQKIMLSEINSRDILNNKKIASETREELGEENKIDTYKNDNIVMKKDVVDVDNKGNVSFSLLTFITILLLLFIFLVL